MQIFVFASTLCINYYLFTMLAKESSVTEEVSAPEYIIESNLLWNFTTTSSGHLVTRLTATNKIVLTTKAHIRAEKPKGGATKNVNCHGAIDIVLLLAIIFLILSLIVI